MRAADKLFLDMPVNIGLTVPRVLLRARRPSPWSNPSYNSEGFGQLLDGRAKQALAAHRDALRAIIRVEKQKPCKGCGVIFPEAVMHFDHLPAYEKKFNISQVFDLLPSEQVLRDEISKCEIICANCHAIRTAQRRASRRGLK